MPVHRVRVEEIDAALCEGCPEATYDQLLAFGTLMLDEVRDRTTMLDTKGMTIIGLGGALVAFLLVTGTATPIWWLPTAIIAPTIVGIFAVLRAYLATRFQDWDWPSEQDWFRRELFNDTEGLRRYHLLSMLETHRCHNDRNAKKFAQLRSAQLALVTASVLTAFLVILSSLTTSS